MWWAHTLLEIGVLFGIIVTLELKIGDGIVGAFETHPHPYWLIVIPMAAARGVVAGMVTSVVATALYLFGAHQANLELPIQELITLETMLEPILFFSVGFLVGEFRDVTTARNYRKSVKLTASRNHARKMREQRDVMAEANRILEKRLVDHTAQFGNLIVAATRIEHAGRREAFEIALELIEEHCGAGASVLMPLTGGSVDFLCHRGWPESESPDRLQEARTCDFVRRAVEEGKIVNGFSLEEAPPDAGPLVVMPLLDENGVIEALLCLDEIPTSRLNASAVRTFLAIGEWVSAVLARLSRTGEDAPVAPSLALLERTPNWLGSPGELAERLVAEYERSTRYGMPLSVVTIQFAEWTDTTPDGLKLVDDYVRRVFTPRLRSSDGVFRFPHPGCYAVLNPGTPLVGGRVVKDRLMRRVEQSTDSTLGPVHMDVTGPDPGAPDAENLLARLVRQFRAEGRLPLGEKSPLALPTSTRVGTLEECVRRLDAEVNLSIRNDLPLEVLGVYSVDEPTSHPGLLAFHIEQIAHRALRRVDGVFSVAPGCVAVTLPHTEHDEAQLVGRRILTLLAYRDPDPAYGEVDFRSMSFGPRYPYHGAFLEGLAAVRPLRDVVPTGGAS
ncbi:MAG: hypothetical protein ABFS86_12805 [Planctomycetota bacterium]